MRAGRFAGNPQLAEARWVASRITRRQRGLRVSTLGLAIGALLTLLGIIQFFNNNTEGGTQWLVLGGVILAAALGLRWWESRRLMRDLTALTTEGSIEEEGVRLTSVASEPIYRWQSFVALEAGDHAVILWLDSGAIIPLTASMFPSPPEFAQAAALLRSKLGQARPKTS